MLDLTRYYYNVHLTEIDFDVKIERFDSAFWILDTTQMAEEFVRLQTEYPDITPIYTENVVQIGRASCRERV